jgi:hypothetical protein
LLNDGGEDVPLFLSSLGGDRGLSGGSEINIQQGRHEGVSMTYKAYIDNIKAKTGRGPEYYLEEAKKKGLVKHDELLGWLKSECGLGHGHANAIILYIKDPELAKRKLTEDAKKEKAKR